MENNNNSVNEVSEEEWYAKIETEKMLKKKKKTKIATGCTLAVCLVLAIAIILLAVVPIGSKPKFIANGFSSISLYHGTETVKEIVKSEDDKYDEFTKKLDKCFDQTCLSSWFNGGFTSYNLRECEDSKETFSLSKYTNNNDYFVCFSYDEEQTLKMSNGKDYISRFQSSGFEDGLIKYTKLYMSVSETDGIDEVVFIIPYSYPTSTTKTHMLTVKIMADTSDLYDFCYNEIRE